MRVLDAARNSPNCRRLEAISEDTQDHLRRKESANRHSLHCLNTGPDLGWRTWSDLPGGRATRHIRNSRMLGVFHSSFGITYQTVMKVILQIWARPERGLLEGYFTNLKLVLDISEPGVTR
jgi:hypothetical protein